MLGIVRGPLIVALALAPAAGSITARTAAAAPSLSDYVILAGAKVTVGGGSIVAGLTGSMFTTAAANEFAITVAGAASVTADVRSAHSVRLNNGAHVNGAVYHPGGTSISLGAGATIGSDVLGDPALPALPAPSVFSSGGTNYTGLPNGTHLTLAPGSYGDVILGGACELNLASGTYTFNTLRSGNGLDLRLNLSGGPIQILVTTIANFGSVDVFTPNGGTTADIYLEAQASGTGTFNAFTAAGGSDWRGTVFAPNGGIHFGGGSCCSTFQGHFWSGTQVDIEHGVNGDGGPVDVQTSSWSSVKHLYQ